MKKLIKELNRTSVCLSILTLIFAACLIILEYKLTTIENICSDSVNPTYRLSTYHQFAELGE